MNKIVGVERLAKLDVVIAGESDTNTDTITDRHTDTDTNSHTNTDSDRLLGCWKNHGIELHYPFVDSFLFLLSSISITSKIRQIHHL